MSVETLDPPMAKKRSHGTDTSIRVDMETAEAIRKASTLKDMSQVEYLREFVLPIARQHMREEATNILSPSPKKKP